MRRLTLLILAGFVPLALAAPARAASLFSFQGLGDLPGGSFGSVANGVSADGSVVVGQSNSASGGEAFRWTSGGDMVSLQDLLVNHGVSNLTGWTLTNATGVSADGRTIVGYGTDPGGNTEAWIATVPVPEPSTWVLALCGAAGRFCPAAPPTAPPIAAATNSREPRTLVRG